MKNAVAIGVIGCGNISDAYFRSLPSFPDVRLAAASDLVMERAKAKAEQYGFRAMTTEELLNDPEIRLVINLTTPEFHTAVNKRILMAGKHAYTEKPFGLDREAGREVLALAASKGLRTGGAPDTFLGGAHQTCRRLVDAGAIGKVVAGTAFMQCHGHESWHPNPAFYYRRGGGPLFDMGPYYLTALVNLLGPVAEVAAFGGRAFDEREITAPAATEKSCKVEVDTHIAAVLRVGRTGESRDELRRLEALSALHRAARHGGIVVGAGPELLRRRGPAFPAASGRVGETEAHARLHRQYARHRGGGSGPLAFRRCSGPRLRRTCVPRSRCHVRHQ